MSKALQIKKYYGFDIETEDPELKSRGESWIFGLGRILCMSVFDAQTKKKLIKYPVKKDFDYLRTIFDDVNAVIIGANISYDILWATKTMGYNIFDMQCEVVDIQVLEGVIDSHAPFSLEELAAKYLGEPKGGGKLKSICAREKRSGDFRSHLWWLWDNGYRDEVEEYALSDSDQAYRVYLEQQKIIKARHLEEAVKWYSLSLRTAIEMKYKGARIDYSKWKKNSEFVSNLLADLQKKFDKKYGRINLNSPAQVGELLLHNNVPIKFKITIRGYAIKDGSNKFSKKQDGFTVDERKAVFKSMKQALPQLRLFKDTLSLECNANDAVVYKTAFEKKGFNVIVSPSTAATALDEFIHDHKIVREYLDISILTSIISKFLGKKFERFIVKEGNEYRIHATFNPLGARTTGRYSSSKPNLQNLPAKIVLFEGTKKEINLSELCREVFIPEEGHVFVRLDFDGQENRWMAYWAIGDEGEYIRECYRRDPNFDEHAYVVKESGLDKEHGAKTARKYAKQVRFASAYGAQARTIARNSKLRLDKAKDIMNKIYAASPWFVLTKDRMVERLSSGAITGIRTFLGREILLPSDRKDTAYRYYNYQIQGSGADQLKVAIGKIWIYLRDKKLNKKIFLPLTIHDENVYSVPIPMLEKIVPALKHEMENAVDAGIPFTSTPEIGPDFAHTKEGVLMAEKNYMDEEELVLD